MFNILIEKLNGKFQYDIINNQLFINGDSLKILSLINDSSIDFVFTDPPYKSEFHGRGMAKHRPMYKKINNYGANSEFNIIPYLNEYLRVLKNKNMFLFCNKGLKYDIQKYCEQYKLSYAEIPFCKTTPIPFTNNQWLSDREWAIHCYKNIKVYGDYKTKRGWEVISNFKESGINHPTSKKHEILRRYIRNISNSGDILLDSFSGSGSIALAAMKEGRKSINIELSTEYYEDSINRLKDIDKSNLFF